MRGAGARLGLGAQHYHRCARSFRRQYQPAAGGEVIAGQRAPCFQQHGGKAAAARGIEPGLQQGAFVLRLDDQQTGGINAQRGQSLAIEPHAWLPARRAAGEQDRLASHMIHDAKGKGHRCRHGMAGGMDFMQLPCPEYGKILFRRLGGRGRSKR